MTILDVLKVLAALVTIYLLILIAKEIGKIIIQKDDYDDKIDLP